MKLIQNFLNKISDRRFWYKTIFTVSFGLLVRYIVLYFQSDIANNFAWIQSDLLFIFTMSFIAIGKTFIETWIEGFNEHRSKWVILIIDYLEDKLKSKHTIGDFKNGETFKNEEALKNTLFMETDKGKRKASDSDLREEYSKRSQPEVEYLLVPLKTNLGI